MTVSSLEPQRGSAATVQPDWGRTIEVAHGRIRLLTIAETDWGRRAGGTDTQVHVRRSIRARSHQHSVGRCVCSTRDLQCVEHAFRPRSVEAACPMVGTVTSSCRVWLHRAVCSFVLFHAPTDKRVAGQALSSNRPAYGLRVLTRTATRSESNSRT